MNDQLRDQRDKGWFHIDHALIDEYGPKIGAIGIAVYTYLVHKADRDGVAWPSYNTIAAALDLSRPTAIKTVRTLADCGLIRVAVVRPKGKRAHNTYTLVTIGKADLPVKDVYQSTGKGDLLVKDVSLIGKADLPVLVNDVDSIKNQLTRTNEQEPIVSLRSTARAKPHKIVLSDYQPTPEMIERAIGYGVPSEQIALHTEQWRDYHAEKGTAIKDFAASWRRWMRNQVVYAERDAARASPFRAPTNGHRPVTFAEQKLRNTLDAHAEFERITDEQESLQRTDGPVGDRLRGGSEHGAIARVLGPGERPQR